MGIDGTRTLPFISALRMLPLKFSVDTLLQVLWREHTPSVPQCVYVGERTERAMNGSAP